MNQDIVQKNHGLFGAFCKISEKKKIEQGRSLSRLLHNENYFVYDNNNDVDYGHHISRMYIAKEGNVVVTHNISNHDIRYKILNYQIFDFDQKKKAVLWYEDKKSLFKKSSLDKPIKTIDTVCSIQNRLYHARYNMNDIVIPEIIMLPNIDMQVNEALNTPLRLSQTHTKHLIRI
jgi:hypothetical protein